MTQQAQRIAIAEFCGYAELIHPFGFVGELVGRMGNHDEHVPDYLASLDAIAQAEARLTPEQIERMENNLWLVLPMDATLWRATAAQRAAALLRTIGKWTDEETEAKL